MASAERTRVEGFGQLEDGLREAGDWYLLGPVPQRAPVGHGPRGLQRRRRRVVLLPPRPRPLPRLPLGRGRHGRLLRRRAAAVPRRWRCGTAATRSSRSGCSGSPAPRPTTARTSRSTGGTSTPFPATPGTAGATTTRRRPFPYDDLIAENGRRGKFDPEYELLDTGVFDDDRYWIVEVDYVKADPDDLLMIGAGHQRRARRRDAARAADGLVPQHVVRGTSTPPKPSLRGAADGAIGIDHPFLGELELLAGPGPGRHRADARCSARTRPTTARLYGSRLGHAVSRRTASTTTSSRGDATVNPDQRGHQGVAAGTRSRSPPARRPSSGCASGRPAPSPAKLSSALGKDFDARRRPAPQGGRRVLRRADPARRSADEAAIMRQAFAGMLWSKQLYAYDVAALARRRPDPADAAGRSR